jgi:hypothetical protein
MTPSAMITLVAHISSFVSVSSSSLAIVELPKKAIRDVDSAIRNDFQSWRDMYFFWLMVSTVLVAIGVLLEEVEEIKKLRRHFGARFAKNLAKFGWFLILVGVIGEGLFEGYMSKTDDWLQTLNTSLLVGAQKDADASDEDAALANERAAILEKDAGDQRVVAARLELQSAQLSKQLITQGPRENLLIGEARATLVKSLNKLSGHNVDVRYTAITMRVNGEIVMSAPIGDDSMGLARVLISVLGEAGLKSPPNPIPTGYQGRGLMVQTPPRASPATVSAAKSLVEKFRKAKLMIDGPFPVDEANAKRLDPKVLYPAFDEDTIILTVLTHP